MDWIAAGRLHPLSYIYQYRLIGLNDNWQEFYPGQSLKFLLPPGNYQLELFASRAFQANAKPAKTISIRVSPPFWLSAWFIMPALVLAMGLAWILLRMAWKRRIKRQLEVLQYERKVQEERERISRDLHDNLGVYANALLYNAELMEAENEHVVPIGKISDLKVAARDILTALRETVWALKHKEHSVEDVFIRVRNYVQSVRKYFPAVRFQISGNADTNHVLSNQEAVNILRIVQEAITNAVKHSNSEVIRIHSEITDQNNWCISVADEGKGFNAAEMMNSGSGNGLENMRFRADDCGIDVRIESDDKGTTILLTVPLSKRVIPVVENE